MTPADRRFLELLARTGLEVSDLDAAWARSTRLTPMLFWLLSAAPDARALTPLLALVAALGPHCGDEFEVVASTLGRVRDETQRYVTCHALVLQWDRAVIDGRPSLAALADAAQSIAEVWTRPDDADTEPLQRAQDTASALVSAWLLRKGGDDSDKLERDAAQGELATLLRRAPRPFA